MQNQKYWPHIPRTHTGIHLRRQNTPLNQSDKAANNQKITIIPQIPPQNNVNIRHSIYRLSGTALIGAERDH